MATAKKTATKKTSPARKTAAKKTAAKKVTAPKAPSFKLPEFKLPEFKAPDFTGLDASKLAGLDDKFVAALRDAAYITVGFGVLAVQQAQVRRRELVKALADRFGTSKNQVEELLSNVEAQLAKLEERFETLEAKLDAGVEKLEDRLPDQAAAFVGQAHDLAKAARKQVRGLIRTAA